MPEPPVGSIALGATMPARTITPEAPTPRGDLELTVPVRVGAGMVTIALEVAHCEWILRMAALLALRDGELLRSQPAWARIVAGHVSDVHGATLCLQSLHVEVSDEEGRVVRVVEFPRDVFTDFASARAAGLLGHGGKPTIGTPGHAAGGTTGRVAGGSDVGGSGRPSVAFSLHAEGMATGRLSVAVPTLATMSISDLEATATPNGHPADDWIVTFVGERVRAGFDELTRRSRASGLEVAGRVAARIGFDPARRAFVRILDDVVIADDGPATAFSVVSTGRSWAEFIATAEDRRAPTSVHTHIHFDPAASVPPPTTMSPPATVPTAVPKVAPSREPIISVDDVLTHLTVFPDPLSACVIVSLFDEGTETTLYGYTPGARLRREPGYWLLGSQGD